MPWYRCIFEDADREVTITIDVLADDNNIVDRALSFFGFYQDNAKSSESAAFIMRHDGVVEYGYSPWVSTLELRGKRLFKDASYSLASYQSRKAMQDNTEPDWSADLILRNFETPKPVSPQQ